MGAIETAAEIEEAEASRRRILVKNAVMPDPVFAKDVQSFVWMEFECVLTTSFFELLNACARSAGDRYLYVQCDDPHIVENVGHPAAARFTSSEALEYDAFLDLHRADSLICLRDIADRMLFWGDLGTWAFVASRDVELCVGGQEGNAEWPLVADIRYHVFDTVIELASGPYRKHLPEDVRRRYEQNYRARSWPTDHYREG